MTKEFKEAIFSGEPKRPRFSKQCDTEFMDGVEFNQNLQMPDELLKAARAWNAEKEAVTFFNSLCSTANIDIDAILSKYQELISFLREIQLKIDGLFAKIISQNYDFDNINSALDELTYSLSSCLPKKNAIWHPTGAYTLIQERSFQVGIGNYFSKRQKEIEETLPECQEYEELDKKTLQELRMLEGMLKKFEEMKRPAERGRIQDTLEEDQQVK